MLPPVITPFVAPGAAGTPATLRTVRSGTSADGTGWARHDGPAGGPSPKANPKPGAVSASTPWKDAAPRAGVRGVGHSLSTVRGYNAVEVIVPDAVCESAASPADRGTLE